MKLLVYAVMAFFVSTPITAIFANVHVHKVQASPKASNHGKRISEDWRVVRSTLKVNNLVEHLDGEMRAFEGGYIKVMSLKQENRALDLAVYEANGRKSFRLEGMLVASASHGVVGFSMSEQDQKSVKMIRKTPNLIRIKLEFNYAQPAKGYLLHEFSVNLPTLNDRFENVDVGDISEIDQRVPFELMGLNASRILTFDGILRRPLKVISENTLSIPHLKDEFNLPNI